MREFRIKLPEREDARRVAGAARSRVVSASANARDRAEDLGGRARDRAREIDAPRINLLDARRLVRDTNGRLEAAYALLTAEHEETAAQMQRLGEVELGAYDVPIREFVGLFERIKHIELSDLTNENAPELTRSFDVDVRTVDFSTVDALKSLAAGSAAGAAAGLTAFAAVGSLATASTGTAIGSLSGAAATNATLAWLGGGTLASGGAGVAGGMVVLGGIVALPVLAIGGLVVHHQGRRAIAEAKQDAASADVVIQEIETARTMARGIRLRAERLTSLVAQLSELSRVRNGVLRHLIDRNDDYATYDEHDRQAVMVAASVVKTLRTVMDVPVIDEEGTLTGASRDAVVAAEQVLAESEGAPS